MGLFILVFFFYLIWLYLAIYESSINDWWTVNEIIGISVSNVKIVVGTGIFIVGGGVLYLFIRKRN